MRWCWRSNYGAQPWKISSSEYKSILVITLSLFCPFRPTLPFDDYGDGDDYDYGDDNYYDYGDYYGDDDDSDDDDDDDDYDYDDYNYDDYDYDDYDYDDYDYVDGSMQ